MKEAPRKNNSSKVAAEKLLRAAGDWVNSRGGNAVVAGNISIMDADPDYPLNFYVLVKITGRRPDLEER